MIIGSITSPSAMEVASFLGSLFFLVAGWNQIQRFLDRQKDKPPAAEVQREALERYATKTECAAKHAALDLLLAELRSQRITDAKDGAASRKGIYTEIESVRKEMGDMERRLNDADERRSSDLHGRLNDILEAVGELRGKVNKS